MRNNYKVKKMKEEKISTVMSEYKSGQLHSGGKMGPIVEDQKQALAIALSEAGLGKKKKEKK